jgi:peroxiredoxin
MKSKLTILISVISVAYAAAQGVGTSAPDFTYDQLGGGSFTLSENTGKVVSIFTFGYNCPPCIQNGPNTQTNIYEVHKNNPDFIAIGIDVWNGGSSGANSFKTATGIQYPILMDGSSFLTLYNTIRDRVIVIDQQGIVQYVSSDKATVAVTQEASDVITNLLGMATTVHGATTTSNEIILQPNTITESLSFSNPFNKEEMAHIRIIDMTGSVKYNKSLVLNDENYLDLGFLAPGIYTFSLTTGQSYRVAKFIKTE